MEQQYELKFRSLEIIKKHFWNFYLKMCIESEIWIWIIILRQWLQILHFLLLLPIHIEPTLQNLQIKTTTTFFETGLIFYSERFLVFTMKIFGNFWKHIFLYCGSPAFAIWASTFWPFSRACSHLMSCATPSIKMLTSWTSDFPSRSAFEISQVPPVEAESTPPVPRAWRPILPIRDLKSFRDETLGIWI